MAAFETCTGPVPVPVGLVGATGVAVAGPLPLPAADPLVGAVPLLGAVALTLDIGGGATALDSGQYVVVKVLVVVVEPVVQTVVPVEVMVTEPPALLVISPDPEDEAPPEPAVEDGPLLEVDGVQLGRVKVPDLLPAPPSTTQLEYVRTDSTYGT